MGSRPIRPREPISMARSGMLASEAIRWRRCGWSSTPNSARSRAIWGCCGAAALICVLLIEGRPDSSKRGSHPSFLDKAFGRGIDRAPSAAPRRVDVERAAEGRWSSAGRLRQRYLVLQWQGMIGHQKFRSEDTIEVE